MKFKKIYLLFFLLILITSSLIAEPIFIKELPVKVYISFDKPYYAMDEEIPLNIEVQNKGNESILLYLEAFKLDNFDIKILNLKDASPVQRDDTYIEELKSSSPELFHPRSFQLYPDEIYKVEVDINKEFKFKEDGRYKIIVEFKPYPMKGGEDIKFVSNPIYLDLKPSEQMRIEQEIIEQINKREEEKVYTPEGTIQFMLDSKIRGDFVNYYRYQNLDKIIQKYDEFKNLYNDASLNMKEDIIEKFKKWDMNRKDRKIPSIAGYKILDVYQSFEKDEATVKCQITYKKPAIFPTYIYQFYLKRQGKKWIVDDFDVINYVKK